MPERCSRLLRLFDFLTLVRKPGIWDNKKKECKQTGRNREEP